LTAQNLRLAQHAQTGIAVHLFEVFEQNKYVYAGRVSLVGNVFPEQQADDEGKPASGICFPAKAGHGTAAAHPPPTRSARSSASGSNS
jgi:hypothetical protein